MIINTIIGLSIIRILKLYMKYDLDILFSDNLKEIISVLIEPTKQCKTDVPVVNIFSENAKIPQIDNSVDVVASAVIDMH